MGQRLGDGWIRPGDCLPMAPVLTLPSRRHALPRSQLPASVQKGTMKYLEVRPKQVFH